MTSRRGRPASLALAAATVCVVATLGIAGRTWLLEEYYLHRLRAGNADAKQAAAQLLGELRVARAAPSLAALLRGESVPYQAAVADALTSIGEPSVAPLIRVLGEGGEARDRAGAILARLGPTAAPAAPAVLAAFKGGVHRSGASILEKIGPAAVPSMIEALETDDEALRLVAATGLESVRRQGAAIPALLRGLDSSDEDVRVRCALALGWMDPEDGARVVPALVERLEKDLDARVRGAAASALGWLRPRDSRTVGALVRKFEDAAEERGVRQSALLALGKIGPPARVVLPTVAAILAARDETLLGTACFAAEHIGPDDFEEELTPLLVGILGDRSLDHNVRAAAAAALGTMKDRTKAIAAVLEPFAADREEPHGLQERVKKALQRLRETGPAR